MDETKKKVHDGVKTIAVNAIALGSIYVQNKYGFAVPPEWQMAALAGVNMVLRHFTKGTVFYKAD